MNGMLIWCLSMLAVACTSLLSVTLLCVCKVEGYGVQNIFSIFIAAVLFAAISSISYERRK
jgi:hypothetical protein